MDDDGGALSRRVAPEPRTDYVTPVGGLDASQVAERTAAGLTNELAARSSRSLAEIARANLLTFFNGLLLALFLLVLSTDQWRNGLFVLVVVANSGIGIVQEWRAKRVLDQLAILTTPKARVVRDRKVVEVTPGGVVLDDLVEVRAGDQVVVDGLVRVSDGLEVDESLLSGESEPIAKAVHDPVRSGSVVVAGQGRFQATAVGAATHAAQLGSEARRFTLARSELVAGTNRLLRWISIGMLVVAPVLAWGQFASPDNASWQQAVTGTVAALVGMVPEGLVLLTSVAFVVAVVTLARRGTLVQQLPAVEVLARVDVVCLDKTGTLTSGRMQCADVEQLGETSADDVACALGLIAGSEENATMTAIAASYPGSSWQITDRVPFSSARKWSGIATDARGSWVLGAPEYVVPAPTLEHEIHARSRADALASAGYRVLLLAHTADSSPWSSGAPSGLPAGLVPTALVVLTEEVRPDAAATLGYFTQQGVSLKVISGDNPHTVGAIAARLGVPGVNSSADAVDARELPEDLDRLADTLQGCSAFGRVTPHQKRHIVAALQRRGHVVAMTGDGVNDALAIKNADIGVALGTGAPATRAVAPVVLLDGRFAHLPDVVAEGRRVTANVERAANLFLVKNVYSLLLALIVTARLAAYPLAPIQLTLVSLLTIGIPGFVLGLGPNRQPYTPGFLRRVLRFAIPVGAVIGVCTYAGYGVTRVIDPQSGVTGGRTTATLVLLIVAGWTVVVLARPITGWRLLLVLGLAVAAAVAVVWPPASSGLFLLHVTGLNALVAASIGAVGCILVQVLGLVRSGGPVRRRDRSSGRRP